MLVTVAICTWNRADLLDRAVAEMHTLEIPVGVEWELLVVNNNCTDHTDEVLRRHEPDLPIRRLFEPQQGHSHARNCAVAAARGELILWTDDDVLVDRRWLAEHVSAAADSPEMSFFGGPIEPHFLSPPPAWLAQTISRYPSAYAIIDFGDEPFDFDHDRTPYGANLAVRTEVQRRYPYDPKYGRMKTELMSGDETMVLWKMLADGHRGHWVPAARVRHSITDDRQTPDYVRRYFYCQGRFAAMRDRQQREHRGLRSRFWILRQALKLEWLYRWRRRTRSPEQWIKEMAISSYNWGRLLG